jgi:hypothetical protein
MLNVNVKDTFLVFKSMLLAALRDPEVAHELWRSANTLDFNFPKGSGFKPRSIYEELSRRAQRSTARYVERHMLQARNYSDKMVLMQHAMAAARPDGLVLEFGVFTGRTINHIAKLTTATVHGFDSFQGLSDDQGIWRQGQFTTSGNLPQVAGNVKLHVGWFDQTLPGFLETHPGPVSFMHVDCDIYQGARTVFELAEARIVPGTVIQFDEYFNHPGWQQGEFKAFQEFVARSGRRYEYLGYLESAMQVAVRITA